MSTPHNEAKKGDIAKTVLMPGDPMRAKYIAENFLEDPVLFNDVRGMLGYTGTYKGKKVSVMGSGMGIPSIGIYSYELFSQYDVEQIIRIGSAGSYTADVKVYDVVLASAAYSESTYARCQSGDPDDLQLPSPELNQHIKETAAKVSDCHLVEACIHSDDAFYRQPEAEHPFYWERLRDEKGCAAVEMESFALFHNAKVLGKKAACLLTITDSFVTGDSIPHEEREKNLADMITLALESV